MAQKQDIDEADAARRVSALLKERARALGANLVGIADTALLEDVETIPADLLAPYRFAVSLAVKIPNDIFEQLSDGPTPLYANHYLNANALLDQIALRLCSFIERSGARALPVPASQPLDWKNFRSHLPSRAVANAAGLGWQGKSLLIVTPQYGPRVRFVSVLTDMALEPDRPLDNRCGSCTRCTDACVAGAIRNVPTRFHYKRPDEAIDLRKCADKLINEFTRRENVQKPICGICIKVCPWGRKIGKGGAG